MLSVGYSQYTALTKLKQFARNELLFKARRDHKESAQNLSMWGPEGFKMCLGDVLFCFKNHILSLRVQYAKVSMIGVWEEDSEGTGKIY